jgi:hypothetical protein
LYPTVEKWIKLRLEWAQEHTISLDISSTIEEELHNVRVAFDRGIMQCSVVVLVYPLVEFRADLAIHLGTYRLP